MPICVNLTHCFWLPNTTPANKYAISYVLASRLDSQMSLNLGCLKRGVWVMQALRHCPETRFLSIAFNKSLILRWWGVFSSFASLQTPGQVPSASISCLLDGILGGQSRDLRQVSRGIQVLGLSLMACMATSGPKRRWAAVFQLLPLSPALRSCYEIRHQRIVQDMFWASKLNHKIINTSHLKLWMVESNS